MTNKRETAILRAQRLQAFTADSQTYSAVLTDASRANASYSISRITKSILAFDQVFQKEESNAT